jgi:hypothetical protein
MRKQPPTKLEQARIRDGFYGSDSSSGLTGAFHLMGPCGANLLIIANTADDPIVKGWEHVSISIKHRPPNWQEMCFAKELFWDDEEAVVQFHPPKSQYVNCHPNCLHLWRDTIHGHRLPDSLLVGPTRHEKNLAE